MSTDESSTPIEELGYEEARDELAEIVTALEHGGLDLDASLALWERGEALATRCEEHLRGARERIEAVISTGSDPDDPEDD
ncbi:MULTISPECIES: exodeoxyribonuclease VII small subunit [Gordonia]|uniref:exodeoxyribonuclease VII small subunit n=1 Tax=Gordonia TaxID=2053 RepID=UPI00071C6FB1|nr:MULTISPECIES: exodeoxyribonuclease VII small subunit [Gordonia]MBR7190790.1 exodeoxyribonuclease VII small subunit [Gordonia sp. SCSIO 19800]MCX2752858.1 exodeoxyribonuclease VII small subunit [Gordonia sp. 4N]MDT0220463.1 exodeoxyribonuclease VII small subunit [Gordonia sp. AC31]UPG69747.1 exodeoxyribonuclease VII small subunit [Gordonia hongkongensis]SCC01481.1 Exodeoxyribonuclease VII small subunit [Gordonia sp. v-85]